MAAPERDWAAETADTVERFVGSIRSKTAEPLQRIVRLAVYGLVAGILGIAALVLLAVLLVRLVDVYLPGDVWSAHVLVGGIFTVTGLLLWRKRGLKTVPSPPA